jgi:ATP/ADP translocase
LHRRQIYVELDFESRYIGKEIINLLANRLGKSVIAASLAIASYMVGEDEQVLSLGFFICCHAFSWAWLYVSLKLSTLQPTVGNKSVG